MSDSSSLSMLSLRQLQYIDLLYNIRHFGKAAEVAGISQPALSAAIAKAESLIGASLFYRDTHVVMPTRYGEIVSRRAQIILNDVKNLNQELTDLRANREAQFSFGIGNIVADTILPEAMGLYRRDHHTSPQFFINYWYELRTMLLDNRLSFYLTANHQTAEDHELSQQHLYDERICFFARADHPILERRSIRCRDVVNYPLATYRTVIARKIVRDNLHTEHELELFERNFPASTVESIHVATKIVALSDWLMMGPVGFCCPEIERGEVRKIEVDDFSLTLQVMAAHRIKSELTRSEQDMLQALIEARNK